MASTPNFRAIVQQAAPAGVGVTVAGAAARAGLLAGDVLLAINGVAVKPVDQVRSVMDKKPRTMALLILRDGSWLRGCPALRWVSLPAAPSAATSLAAGPGGAPGGNRPQ